MTCRTCGTAIDDNLTICPACGAEMFIRRRRQRPVTQQTITGEAAKRYHEMMKTGANPRVRPPVMKDSHGVVKPSTGAPRRQQIQRHVRNASERPAAAHAAERPIKRAGSMPAKETRPGTAAGSASQPRMVRRHEYRAIVPESSDTFNWMKLLVISFVCVLVLTIGVYFFLARTSPGQIFLASMGREASSEAYHTMGRRYMENGSISRAVRALEIAQSKNPNDLELLVDLGKAYKGSNQVEKAELAYTRAIEHYPAYPEPYQLVIDIMLDQNRNYEAIQLVELALDETGDERFETMLTRLLPPAPTVDKKGTRYATEIDLFLDCTDEEVTIYYTLTDDDPIEEGIEYVRGEPIHLTEKSAWRLRAVSEKNGMYSRETVQTYSIIKEQPDMPSTNLARGSYKAGTTVRLRAGDDVEAIYYTVDGTRATTESKRYDPEKPIELGIGNITIRAIAVNYEGKISNELNITYEGTGTTKTSMSEKDTIDGLTLYQTTRTEFIQNYGEPQSEAPAGKDVNGTYTKLTYSFGYATFVARTEESEPLLAELYTSSTAFQGPRGTAVGSRMEDVIGVFRDHLGEANANGDRVLYNRTTGQSAFLTNEGDGHYKISYYHRLENKQYIELTYHVVGGLVEHMEWLQYSTP